MIDNVLNIYLNALTHLKRGNGIAPHKPILLISLIELIEKGKVKENKIYVNADLVGTFKENWEILVITVHQSEFTLPFYHLQNDKVMNRPFWFLIPNLGCKMDAYIKSVRTLANVIDYGSFSEELYFLLINPYSRNLIKEALLEAYFPETKSKLHGINKNLGYVQQLENYILKEPDSDYKKIQIETEEDFFVRGGLFKKLVPRVYSTTCSFTGMKLSSTHGHNFVDACHIVPFSVTHDDKISNGIALCPNMHRAFDRGLLSIDNNYSIIISSGIIEDEEHIYGIKQLKGSPVILPTNSQYYPDKENLIWHRENVFKQ